MPPQLATPKAARCEAARHTRRQVPDWPSPAAGRLRRGTPLRQAVQALKPRPGPAVERPPRTQPELLRSTHPGAPALCLFRVACLEINFGELHQTPHTWKEKSTSASYPSLLPPRSNPVGATASCPFRTCSPINSLSIFFGRINSLSFE